MSIVRVDLIDHLRRAAANVRRNLKKGEYTRGVSDHVEKGEERKKLILPVESSLQNTRYSEEVGFRSKRLYLHAKPWERQVALRP